MDPCRSACGAARCILVLIIGLSSAGGLPCTGALAPWEHRPFSRPDLPIKGEEEGQGEDWVSEDVLAATAVLSAPAAARPVAEGVGAPLPADLLELLPAELSLSTGGDSATAVQGSEAGLLALLLGRQSSAPAADEVEWEDVDAPGTSGDPHQT